MYGWVIWVSCFSTDLQCWVEWAEPPDLLDNNLPMNSDTPFFLPIVYSFPLVVVSWWVRKITVYIGHKQYITVGIYMLKQYDVLFKHLMLIIFVLTIKRNRGYYGK